MKSNQSPLIPPLTPVYGAGRLWELEDDDAYLKYLYPQITRQISEFVEEVCDQMEHEGSLMFDQYPDRTALQILASGIEKDFRKKVERIKSHMPGKKNVPWHILAERFLLYRKVISCKSKKHQFLNRCFSLSFT